MKGRSIAPSGKSVIGTGIFAVGARDPKKIMQRQQ